MTLDIFLRKFNNDEDRRIARILLKVIFALLVAYVIILGTGIFWGDQMLILAILIAAMWLFMPVGLLYFGYLQAGSIAVVVIVLVTTTAIATLGQGIHDLAMMGFPVIIMVASLIMRRRQFLICSGLVLAAAAWLVFGESAGFFISKTYETPSFSDFVVIATILIIGIAAVDMLAENMRESMFRAKSEIGRRQMMESQLRHQSTHDGLTGVYNRFFFEQELARLEKSSNYPISIIVADLDDLKVVNDAKGHAVGDHLLVQTAAALRATFRSNDVVARIGGDEFAVLLPGTDSETVHHLLTRVRSRLNEHNAVNAGQEVHLSLGTATADLGSLAETFTQADRDMYVDKAMRKLQRP